ncbi:MAG: pseudouridine synthase [Verrucomicrobiota bacterium]
MKKNTHMRLNQFLASAGLGSRRACEAFVLEGRVSINGKIIRNLATRISAQDAVSVDGKPLQSETALTIALNKPKGYVCSAVADKKYPTIFELLPKKFPRLFYIGRLDADSEGLLLLTNQGALAQKLTHPRYKLPKTYIVRLDRPFNFELVQKFLKGFPIESGFAKMEAIYRFSKSELKVILLQGLKRQIRHMFYRFGYEVVHLQRIQIGRFHLGHLPLGKWRVLSKKEQAFLTMNICPETTN